MTVLPELFLECKNLCCGYETGAVISGVSFKVQAGEVVALLGPNGSGKSTLLRTLCGSLKTLSGELKITGKPLSGIPSAERAQLTAFVPQEEIPAFDFSALQVVLMGRLAHTSGLFETRQDYEVARRVMRDTDCHQFADRKVTELSGGERQRVLVARALAQEAPLLLLDEPTSHLDPSHNVEMARLIKRLASAGKGVVCAVHDLNWAAAVASTCILLGNGTVHAHGPVSHVFAGDALEGAFKTEFERCTRSDQKQFVYPSGLNLD